MYAAENWQCREGSVSDALKMWLYCTTTISNDSNNKTMDAQCCCVYWQSKTWHTQADCQWKRLGVAVHNAVDNAWLWWLANMPVSVVVRRDITEGLGYDIASCT